MLVAGLALLAPLICASPQEGGAEAMASQLAERSAERRAVAVRTWQEHGEAWLAAADEQARGFLLERSPEIQEPLMAALWAEAATEVPAPERIQALLGLLGESMNGAGADRLVRGRPRLPASMRLAAVEAALKRGSGAAELAAEGYLRTGRPEERSRALRILLSFGGASHAAAWLEPAPWAELDLAQVGSGLQALALRQALPEDFRLPEAAFALRHPQMIRGVLAVLEKRPDRLSEEFLGEIALMAAAEEQDRRRALAAIEVAAPEFRWRRVIRDLESFLDGVGNDPMAEDIAWTLHRLESKKGSSFLTAEMRAGVKANPSDYRSRFRLGARYVDMAMFKDGFKEFKAGIQDLQGTPQYTRIDRLTWVSAARAACGSRRYTEGLEWLKNARMSPRELEEYRALPEFEDALAKPAFKKVFGIQ
ncbi:MAG: hypothetical protein ISR76_03760 [Planctomycetes bacterium]|nr:hypothetical protein [Planctomycetota bacterium]MBL7008088.1 hypothetical protein [Planctomycetota bacterium]